MRNVSASAGAAALNMSKSAVKWEVTAKKLAKKAIKDKELLPELAWGILFKEHKTRYTSFRELMSFGSLTQTSSSR